MIDASDTGARGPERNRGFSLGRWLGRAVARWLEAERRSRDIATLRGMSDHQLRDIGLTRADVFAAGRGRGPVFGERADGRHDDLYAHLAAEPDYARRPAEGTLSAAVSVFAATIRTATFH